MIFRSEENSHGCGTAGIAVTQHRFVTGLLHIFIFVTVSLCEKKIYPG
jgi:hypothetical protein